MSACRYSRRQVLRMMGGTAGLAAAGGAGLLAGSLPGHLFGAGKPAAVAVASGGGPAENVRRAVAALGGMGAFVSRGDVVVLKPNIGWDRTPAQAANTDPEVVVAVAELCLAAGAKAVRVFDRTCNEPRRCYVTSGIKEAVERFAKNHHAAGMLRIDHVEDRRFVRTKIPGAAALKEWDLYRDALEADRIVNVPVAKHHSLATVTLGLKNMMGVMGGNRGQIHYRLPECLADVNRHFPKQLVIVDATRVLLRNGPTGGDLADVRADGRIFVSDDIVAADAVAARTVFGLRPRAVAHIRWAMEAGLGIADPAQIRVIGS